MKRVLALTTLILLLAPFAVHGQDAVAFDRLVVDIWPEYDKPSVLIIYRGRLSSRVSLPAQVTFQIPAEAGQPNAVAVRGAEGQLMSVQYERVVKGDTADITFTATSQEIQFEYYDPGLEKVGDQRSYVYQWPGIHAVRSIIFQVQRPRGAFNLEISPAFGESYQGSEDLTYYRKGESNLEVGEKRPIRIQYNKASDSPSVGDQPIQPSTPIEPQLSFSYRGWDLIPWLIGGLGLLLILGAIGFYWWFGEKRTSPLQMDRNRTAKGPVLSDQASYCPQCGSRRGENDRFCRVCGQKL